MVNTMDLFLTTYCCRPFLGYRKKTVMVTPLVGVEHGQEASILLVQVGVVTEVVV